MRIKLSRFLQLKCNVFMYKWLGWEVCFYYILLLGKIYFLLNRNEKGKIANSISYVFENKDPSEIRDISKKVFRGILSHYYEKIFNAYEEIGPLRSFFQSHIEAGYLYKLDHALKAGKGVLFVTGHYGAIEYIPILLAVKGYPISVVAKFATRQLEETLHEKTRNIGLRIINAGRGSVLSSIMRELRQNRIVFIECDEIEEWRPSKRNRMWFLGKLIEIDKSIDIIQRRAGAEIIFGLLHRFNLNRYYLILEDYQGMLSRFGMQEASVGEIALKYLEEYIYYYPEEWYQWKNYYALDGEPSVERRVMGKGTSSLFEPAFVNAA